MDQLSQPPQPSVPVCGIGASAGGVEALQQFFSALPTDLGLAYVVIVHLAPDHKSELPSILRRWTTMPVIQVGDHNEVPLKPDQVYVIAPDRKLEITDTAVGASAFEQPRGKRAAIDLFFRSLAQTHGDGFAVLLSGSGSDGAVGAKAVKERGGLILVQDPSEAAHSGMPRAAIATGIADIVLPVRELVGRLAALARARQHVVIGAQVTGDAAEQVPVEEERALRDVLDVLRKRTGHDFSKYKRSTVLRRLSRRMQLAHRRTIAEYLEYLRASVPEAHALLNDLLISVTTFFRDPDAWAALQAQVIAPLVEQSDPDTQVRAGYRVARRVRRRTPWRCSFTRSSRITIGRQTSSSLRPMSTTPRSPSPGRGCTPRRSALMFPTLGCTGTFALTTITTGCWPKSGIISSLPRTAS